MRFQWNVNASIQRIHLYDFIFYMYSVLKAKAEREKLDLYCATLIFHNNTHLNTSMIRKPDLECLLDVDIFILTWKAGKHDDIFFECSMLENRLHLSLMTHQDLSLGHDVIDTLCKISVYFHVKKNFLLCNVWDQLDHSLLQRGSR